MIACTEVHYTYARYCRFWAWKTKCNANDDPAETSVEIAFGDSGD
jgi:hypothetical protein